MSATLAPMSPAAQLLAAAAAEEAAANERIRIGAASGEQLERMILWGKQFEVESEQRLAALQNREQVIIPNIPTDRVGVYKYFDYLNTVAAGRHTTGDHVRVFSPLAKGVADEIFNGYFGDNDIITWQAAHDLCAEYFLDREFEGNWNPKRNKPGDLMELDDILFWLGH